MMMKFYKKLRLEEQRGREREAEMDERNGRR